jgi:hypothetical protein
LTSPENIEKVLKQQKKKRKKSLKQERKKATEERKKGNKKSVKRPQKWSKHIDVDDPYTPQSSFNEEADSNTCTENWENYIITIKKR